MFTLQTDRLTIRPLALDDLPAVYAILDLESASPADDESLAARARWLQWTVLSYEQLTRLHQPPYGERAIVRRDTDRLIGLCGFVPLLAPYAQMPAPLGNGARTDSYTSELGLYYAVSPAHQRAGYATEAARVLIAYAFDELHISRILATTTYDNLASQQVMRHLGMQLLRNPYPDPPWLQVVGVLVRDS